MRSPYLKYDIGQNHHVGDVDGLDQAVLVLSIDVGGYPLTTPHSPFSLYHPNQKRLKGNAIDLFTIVISTGLVRIGNESSKFNAYRIPFRIQFRNNY